MNSNNGGKNSHNGGIDSHNGGMKTHNVIGMKSHNGWDEIT